MENLMEKIRIITDSASDLSASTREDLTILPLAIRFGDTEYLDEMCIRDSRCIFWHSPGINPAVRYDEPLIPVTGAGQSPECPVCLHV